MTHLRSVEGCSFYPFDVLPCVIAHTLVLRTRFTNTNGFPNRNARSESCGRPACSTCPHRIFVTHNEADLARRRYLQVDPDNRLVADQLEADWNTKLRDLRSAQEEYEHQQENEQRICHAEQRERIRALATDFPRVWNDPSLPYRERKRMARLLLEDVTLRKEQKVIAQVRFRGGALKTLELPLPLPFCVLSRTRPEVVEAIDELLGEHEYREIADL